MENSNDKAAKRREFLAGKPTATSAEGILASAVQGAQPPPTPGSIGYRFGLPYIYQPPGHTHIVYDGVDYCVRVRHIIVPELFGVVTGFAYNPAKPLGVSGPSELYLGVSRVSVAFKAENVFADPNDEIRMTLADVLNALQYKYLVVSKKYWFQSVAPDHFVNLEIKSTHHVSHASSWGASRRGLLPYRGDDSPEIRADLATIAASGERLPAWQVFLIDAKRHYLTREYHLMYAELQIAFESLMQPAMKKICDAFERDMINDGMTFGKIAFLLFNK